MDSTWESRDLPVLVAGAERLDPGPGGLFGSFDLAPDLGRLHDETAAALAALVSGGYITGSVNVDFSGSADVIVRGVTERGRRAVGLWPSGEGVDALVDALRQAADQVEDGDDRGFLRRAAGMLGGVSRDVMTDVMAAVIRQQAGLG